MIPSPPSALLPVSLPARFALDGTLSGNRLRQLHLPPEEAEQTTAPPGAPSRTLFAKRASGALVQVSTAPPSRAWADEVLVRPQPGSPARWVRPIPLSPADEKARDARSRRDAVRASWEGAFRFRLESPSGEGLRPPQEGAVHASIAHWTLERSPATIVLPTGTGKTESMLALLVAERPECLLVLVPTAALRTQTSAKFESLGLLRRLGVALPKAGFPVVGTIEHRLGSEREVDALFGRCNVLVATMAVLSRCSTAVQRRIAAACSLLFIDEAHHVTAPTWAAFRDHFRNTPILQFTATPFRNDGQPVDGKPIYVYPLRKAQEEKYFKPITFHPVREYDPRHVDDAIARAALTQLDADLAAGHDHLLMARTASIAESKRVHDIYASLAPEKSPLLLHSGLSDRTRAAALAALADGRSRVVVCVDMLGEGFDLPKLKIAALHEAHKSLAVTIQFIGRFTRKAGAIGDASVFANVVDPRVAESLLELYAQDADWNVLLRRLADTGTKREVRRSEFLAGFPADAGSVPVQNLLPKLSTVVYETPSGTFRPERIRGVVPSKVLYAGPVVHRAAHVAAFLTREQDPVPWGSVRDLRNTAWHLYLLHWDAARNLLFVNSSNNATLHEGLAAAVCGKTATRIQGERVYRVLHGINRLMLLNLGLVHTVSHFLSFTMYAGTDIQKVITASQASNRIKSNLFGKGFAGGERATIGCSTRGRIWSHRVADGVHEWVDWCHGVADKLLDESISTQDVIDDCLFVKDVKDRPASAPIVVEWPQRILGEDESRVTVAIGGESAPLFDVDLSLRSHDTTGPLRFRITVGSATADYELRFEKGIARYLRVGKPDATVTMGRKVRPLLELLREHPPRFLFADGTLLEESRAVPPRQGRPRVFKPSTIARWDWADTDIHKESQGPAREADSIQARVIRSVLDDPVGWDVVFDDDGTGEAADVVALKVEGERLRAALHHCKFSSADTPGARLEDLYVVCGQAQRSVHYRGDLARLILHLERREALRLGRGRPTRFERGTLDDLIRIRRAAPSLSHEMTISIVQPGLSASRLGPEHLELLGVTASYLMETFEVPLRVVASG
jgi:superfamily II DNA or RNA helicase